MPHVHRLPLAGAATSVAVSGPPLRVVGGRRLPETRLTPLQAASALCPPDGAALIFLDGTLIAHEISGERLPAVVDAVMGKTPLPLRGQHRRRETVGQLTVSGDIDGVPTMELRHAPERMTVWIVGSDDAPAAERVVRATSAGTQETRLSDAGLWQALTSVEDLNAETHEGHVVIAVLPAGDAARAALRRTIAAALIGGGTRAHETAQEVYVLTGPASAVVRAVCDSHDVAVGVSCVVRSGTSLPAARAQAAIALEVALTNGRRVVDPAHLGDWLACARLVARDAVAASPLSARDPLVALAAEPVLRETLDAWLDNPFHTAEVAAQLGLHVNSLRYRLRRIEELLEVSLNDTEVRNILGLIRRF